MAASDPHPSFDRLPPRGEGFPGPTALRERMDEEISRAERHGTHLSCLLVVIENLEEMTREHGSDLREQTLDYVAQALRRELRRFDRVGRGGRGVQGDAWDSDHDLLIILPGADGPRAEVVARRTLERLRTVKIEARGTRWPLHVSVGLAAWKADLSAQSLLAYARAALRPANGESASAVPDSTATPEQEQAVAATVRAPGA
jgi:diguanylate cyclase (GGDEF)-like protein